MKATLKFNLPEDAYEHLIAVHAMDWALVVFDLENFLREKLKYGHKYKSADEALREVRDALHSMLEVRNISIDMIG